MTTDPGNKSAADLEKEVESSRGQVARTLDALRERASPGQLVDQALGYARESGGGEFARNLGRSVRDNPLPILMIGAGIGWLMTAGSARQPARPTPVAPPRAQPSQVATTAKRDPSAIAQMQSAQGGLGASVSSAGRAAAGTASSAAAKASDALSAASGAASSAYHGATEAVGGMAGSARHAIGSTGATVGLYASDLAHETADGAHRLGDYAQRHWSRLAQDQPLVLGALGIALGAAFGAALPSTRTENGLMGETSDALKSQAMAKATDHYERARQVAGETYREVIDDLDERGYSKEGARDALSSTTDKVKSALHGAKEEAEHEIRNAGTASSATASATATGAADPTPSSPSPGNPPPENRIPKFPDPSTT